MKTRKLKLVLSLMVVSMLLIGNTAMAQRGQRNGQGYGQGPAVNRSQVDRKVEIPNLSDDQKAKIETLTTKALKESNLLRSQLKERRAHLNTLSIADNADQKTIDTEIDEIGKLQTKLIKVHAKLRQDIRALLDDDQKAYFDIHYRQIMRGQIGNRMGNPRNCRAGQGPYCR